jgi:hypothetical protein
MLKISVTFLLTKSETKKDLKIMSQPLQINIFITNLKGQRLKISAKTYSHFNRINFITPVLRRGLIRQSPSTAF